MDTALMCAASGVIGVILAALVSQREQAKVNEKQREYISNRMDELNEKHETLLEFVNDSILPRIEVLESKMNDVLPDLTSSIQRIAAVEGKQVAPKPTPRTASQAKREAEQRLSKGEVS